MKNFYTKNTTWGFHKKKIIFIEMSQYIQD